MTDEIRDLLTRAEELVQENQTVITRVTEEGRRTDQRFATTYEAIQRSLGTLSRAWRA